MASWPTSSLIIHLGEERRLTVGHKSEEIKPIDKKASTKQVQSEETANEIEIERDR